MRVPVLQAGAPHHDTVIQQGPFAFPQAGHLFHHVGELGDVEGGDRGDFGDLAWLIIVVGLRVVLVLEAKLRIGDPVGRGANISADAGGVRLERQHIEVAHHLHILTAFVSLGNFDLDGRGIGSVAFTGTDAGRLQGRLFLAVFDGGNAAFHGAHAVQIFIQFVLVVPGQLPAQVPRAAEDQIQHLAVQRVRLGEVPGLTGLSKKPVEHAAGIGFGRDGLGGRAEAAVRIIPLIESLLIFLVRLGHRGQFQRRQGRQPAHVVGRDLIRRDGNVDLIPPVRVRQHRGEPGR